MSFSPNLVGQLSRLTGRDIHSRPIYAAAIGCPFAFVNQLEDVVKTAVRADSSASRGAAEEAVTPHDRILIDNGVVPKLNDKFVFAGDTYSISGIHQRYSVFGDLDHYECQIEVLVE